VAETIAIDFYLGVGSRYSYLAASQVERIEASYGCRFVWKPIASGALMDRRGGNPFRAAPVSGQYDWGYGEYDTRCWASFYGIPFREPPNPHFDYRLLVKAATAAKRLGAVVPYSHAFFRSVRVEGVWPLTAVCDCAISTTSTLAAPTAIRKLAIRSGTISYASSTTRASSVTSPRDTSRA